MAPLAKTEKDPVLIGAGSDSAGLILHTSFSRSSLFAVYETLPFDFYSVMDCCSSTSQWTLSDNSNSVNIMAMCPDSAAEFIQKDDRFSIVGPLVYNADVLVTNTGEQSPKVIGYMQGKERQKRILEKNYGAQVTMQPMLFYALPYALEKGRIDGAVLDIMTAVQLNYPISPLIDEEPSYVLVASKEFINSEEYKDFIRQYNATVENLKTSGELQGSLESFLNKTELDEEVKKWEQIPIQYGKLEVY